MSFDEQELSLGDFVAVDLKKKDRVFFMPDDGFEVDGKSITFFLNEDEVEENLVEAEFKRQDKSTLYQSVIFENGFTFEREILKLRIWKNIESAEKQLQNYNLTLKDVPIVYQDPEMSKRDFYSSCVLELVIS